LFIGLLKYSKDLEILILTHLSTEMGQGLGTIVSHSTIETLETAFGIKKLLPTTGSDGWFNQGF